MDNRPIGFFDSGVGGLTCINAMQQRLPNERVVYFGDTARAPYGSKSPETIRAFSNQIADYLVEHDVKMIVIACNTISAWCLDALRRRHPGIPIISVIEPIAKKIAREEAPGTCIGVLGTKATVASGVYANIITSRNKDIRLFSMATPLFVPLIEEGIVDHQIMDLTIKHYADDFIRLNKIQKIVLGCTHYPFLKTNFERLYPDLGLLNPSEVVIDEVESVLTELDAFAEPDIAPEHVCYASDLSENFQNIVNMVFKDPESVQIKFKKFED